MSYPNTYKVRFIEPSTGHVLYENGTRFRGASPDLRSEWEFISLNRAKTFCHSLVRRYPYLQCIVRDENDSEVWRFHDEEWFIQRSADTKARFTAQRIKDKSIFLGFLLIYSVVVVGMAITLASVGLAIWLVLCATALFATLVWLMIVALFK
jgi:hypothetical protein